MASRDLFVAFFNDFKHDRGALSILEEPIIMLEAIDWSEQDQPAGTPHDPSR